MQARFKAERLSNLYKPAIIMISTYLLVNVVGFFVQHVPQRNEISKSDPMISITKINKTAQEFLLLKESVVSPAPPEVKILPERKAPSKGESINPHLP